jgi:uncharacterized LabA/DUF88 family protein
MTVELQHKRVIAFVDGQNLFNAAKQAFGYDFPNYDAVKLAQLVCEQRGQEQQEHWTLVKLHFYTGMPSPTKDEPRNNFWKSKLTAMGRNKELVQTFSRPLVYRDGTGREKGIDVRLALDAVRLAHENEYDAALIFSQDQDFSELAIEIKRIAAVQNRWVSVVSAYPFGAGYGDKSGIDKTDWFRIDKTLYDQAIDTYDYRKLVEK